MNKDYNKAVEKYKKDDTWCYPFDEFWFNQGWFDGYKIAIKKVFEIAEKLNEKFRKDNTPQRLSGDEFNDIWEEELKLELEKLKGEKEK